MSKSIYLKSNIELGVVPTHVKFMGGLVPDANGKLPRDAAGEFVVVAEMKRLMERSTVAITGVQISFFCGADKADVTAFFQALQGLGLKVYLIMMVGGVDPMSPADEDSVVAQLVEGLEAAKRFNVTAVASTSFEEWMVEGAVRKEGEAFDQAVQQLVKVHLRAYREAQVEGSCIKEWQLEFLRGVEFATFTDLGSAWQVVRAANDSLGKTFFKVLIDAAHCGDSGLSIDENAQLIAQIARSGELGMFHASAPTTRGRLSTDDEWLGTLLDACAMTGELRQVYIEIFHHEDPALDGLRTAVPGHGVDTTGGRGYSELVLEGLESLARRINHTI